MNAVTLKNYLTSSRIFENSYARVLSLAAVLNSVRGKPWTSVDLRMRGWRGRAARGLSSSDLQTIREFALNATFESAELGAIADNRLHAQFLATSEADTLRRQWGREPIEDRVRMRYHRDNDDPERQGDLIILKPFDASTGERGVIELSFTERIRAFPAVFDLPALATQYQLLMQPSWWGYQDATFFLYLGLDVEALIQSPWQPDYDYVNGLNTNLRATRIGAGDWIDPAVFRPAPTGEKRFDLVMVSSWGPVKRHSELFEAMARIRQDHGVDLRVALVGFPNGWTQEHIARLARKAGVLASCTFFESIPHSEVAAIVADSSAYILLSRREGANRGLYEAIMSDTPILIAKNHRGVNAEHVNAETGLFFEDGGLDRAIVQILRERSRFGPRSWALKHTGYEIATQAVNKALREMSEAHDRPWHRDIVASRMAPTLRYASHGVYTDFTDEYNRLTQFLRPE